MTDAYYWWDGRRSALVAQRRGSTWSYGKIRTSADRRAEAALWCSVLAVFLWFLLVPLLLALVFTWDAGRQYKRSGERRSRALDVAIGLIILDLFCLLYGTAVLGGFPLIWWLF